MASRYWVGGAGTWNTTTTHWSSTSGGASGSVAPTAADDVHFDANSGGGTVTLSGALLALSIDCTGFTGLFASSGTIAISGNVTVGSGMGTSTNTGTWTINAACTFTSNGKSLSNTVTLNTGGSPSTTMTLADAFTSSASLNVTSGTLDAATNNVNVTIAGFTATNANAVVNMGSGLWTYTGNGTAFGISASSTINPGTSTLKFTASGVGSITGVGGPGTLNNVWVSGAITFNVQGGSCTFNDLKIDGGAGRTVKITAGNTLTVSSLTLSSAITFGSSAPGSSWNLSTSATLNISSTAISDCARIGTGSLTVTSGLDGGDNTGITFTSGGGGSGFSFGVIGV